MFGGNNVIAEIQAGGDGGLQIIFRTADFGGVWQERCLLDLGDVAQIADVGVQVIE